MVIETDTIHEPRDGRPGNLLLVPVEIEGRPDSPEGGARREDQSPDRDGKDDARPGKLEHSDERPPLRRRLLIPGLVGLACGIGGAWGYSHFFGSDKKDDKGGAKSSSNSGKDSGSGGDSGSGKGSQSGKGSNPGRGPVAGKGGDSSDDGKALEDEKEERQAWITAMNELKHARDAEKKASDSADESKAVLEFLKSTLLSAGRPGGPSLSGAFWAGGQGQDVTLRKAVDAAESKAGEVFANRPLAEASVRETLGLAYMNLGDPEQSVKQYRQALALRQATQGFDSPETATCRNQLAVAYRVAGHPDEGGRLFERSPRSLSEADALAERGASLLLQGKPAEAELKLRQSLEVRRKVRPDGWATFDAESELGEALLDQKKYAEAEPLLTSGYEGLKRHEADIPPDDRPRVARALQRLVKLYRAWGRPDEAKRWQEALVATPGTTSK